MFLRKTTKKVDPKREKSLVLLNFNIWKNDKFKCFRRKDGLR